MTPLSRHTLIALTFVAVVLGLYYNIAALPLFDVDEGAFSEASREMAQRGDYLSPYLYGEPRHDKPILTYWLQAASISVFGVNELAFRLPSVLAATLWVLSVFLFVRHVGDTRGALLAVVFMVTSVAVPVIAKAATADALLNLFITAAMFSVYLYYRRRARRYIYFAFAAMALGFLTKGPVAVLIPFVVSGVFFAIRGETGAWVRAALHPGGVLLFLVIALPWYVLQALAEGMGFVQGFFGMHNVGRFTGAMEGHGGSILYFVPVVLVALVPYTAVFIKLLAGLKPLLRQDLALYAMLWFGFVFIFFSLSATKLPHYIVYGLPPVFVLMAVYFNDMKHPAWAFLPALLFFLLLWLLPEVIAAALPRIEDAFVKSMLDGYEAYFTWGYRAFFLAALLLSLYFIFDTRLSQDLKLIICGLMVTAGTVQFLLPVAAAIQQQPVKEAALLAKARDYDVVMWRLDRPSFAVYSEQPVQRRRPRPGEVVVTKAVNLAYLAEYEVIYARNGIALARVLEPGGGRR